MKFGQLKIDGVKNPTDSILDNKSTSFQNLCQRSTIAILCKFSHLPTCEHIFHLFDLSPLASLPPFSVASLVIQNELTWMKGASQKLAPVPS